MRHPIQITGVLLGIISESRDFIRGRLHVGEGTAVRGQLFYGLTRNKPRAGFLVGGTYRLTGGHEGSVFSFLQASTVSPPPEPQPTPAGESL